MATKTPGKPARPEEPPNTGRKGWRRRIPTPIVVTILGIALSAWLIPAITRQWDDRQKAHDIQTSLVTEMSAATAQALSAGEDALERNPTSGRPSRQNAGTIPVAERDWTVASLRIQARLRAYLSSATVDDWRAYSALMKDALVSAFRRPPVEAFTLGGEVSLAAPGVSLNRASGALGALDRTLGNPRSSPDDIVFGYGKVEEALIALENQMARKVLESHLTGYSTTWRDLIRDLVP